MEGGDARASAEFRARRVNPQSAGQDGARTALVARGQAMRGGKTTNYDAASVDAAARDVAGAGLAARLMIDFSHANSLKLYENQVQVGVDVAAQLTGGEERIIGVMVESHIKAGRQDLLSGKPLEYGVSITDGCIGWEDTVALLESLASAARRRRATIADR